MVRRAPALPCPQQGSALSSSAAAFGTRACRVAICHGKTKDSALAGVMAGEKEILITSYGMYRWAGVGD